MKKKKIKKVKESTQRGGRGGERKDGAADSTCYREDIEVCIN